MLKSSLMLLGLAAASLSALAQTPAAPARAGAPAAPAAAAPASCPALLHQNFKRLQDEAPQDLCQYAGKVVLGFPSNDFKQESANAKEIADLCYNTYGVKFPMFSTTVVSGPNANPLHASLAKQTGKEPKWNFTKYLIGRDGKVIEHFPSKVAPEDPALVSKIEAAL